MVRGQRQLACSAKGMDPELSMRWPHLWAKVVVVVGEPKKGVLADKYHSFGGSGASRRHFSAFPRLGYGREREECWIFGRPFVP
jgi:hypothetical protein